MDSILPHGDSIMIVALTCALGFVSAIRLRRSAEKDADAKKVREEQRRIEDLYRRGLLTLLELGIAQLHRHACESGKVGRYQLRTALSLWAIYKELGGNGFLDELAGELKNLPYSDIDEVAGGMQR